MGKHVRRWGAIYVLAALFLASWIGQFVAQLIEAGNNARNHGESFSMSEFWPQFWQATFENWQSEWLQLFVQGVVLLGMKHFLFKADAEDMEKLDWKVNALLEHAGLDHTEIERRYEAQE